MADFFPAVVFSFLNFRYLRWEIGGVKVGPKKQPLIPFRFLKIQVFENVIQTLFLSAKMLYLVKVPPKSGPYLGEQGPKNP